MHRQTGGRLGEQRGKTTHLLAFDGKFISRITLSVLCQSCACGRACTCGMYVHMVIMSRTYGMYVHMVIMSHTYGMYVHMVIMCVIVSM